MQELGEYKCVKKKMEMKKEEGAAEFLGDKMENFELLPS